MWGKENLGRHRTTLSLTMAGLFQNTSPLPPSDQTIPGVSLRGLGLDAPALSAYYF